MTWPPRRGEFCSWADLLGHVKRNPARQCATAAGAMPVGHAGRLSFTSARDKLNQLLLTLKLRPRFLGNSNRPLMQNSKLAMECFLQTYMADYFGCLSSSFASFLASSVEMSPSGFWSQSSSNSWSLRPVTSYHVLAASIAAARMMA